MDPVLAEFLTDATMIIGPAVVTGFFAYQAAAHQSKATLQKIREANEFSARQHLFDYYKERQKRFSEGYTNLVNTMGQVLGVNAAAFDSNSDVGLDKLVDGFNSIVGLHLSAAPFEISLVLRDMVAKKLDGTEEFKELEVKKARVADLTAGTDYETTKSTVNALIEVYGELERCNQLLMEKEMDRLFSKYVG